LAFDGIGHQVLSCMATAAAIVRRARLRPVRRSQHGRPDDAYDAFVRSQSGSWADRIPHLWRVNAFARSRHARPAA
jgi:hypothetical protein